MTKTAAALDAHLTKHTELVHQLLHEGDRVARELLNRRIVALEDLIDAAADACATEHKLYVFSY